MFKWKNKIGTHPALFLFKRNIFWWQKIDLKKRRRKADSVKHSESDKYVDSDKQTEFDSITLEKRGTFTFFYITFYFINLLAEIKEFIVY